jgi:hypothetical protein
MRLGLGVGLCLNRKKTLWTPAQLATALWLDAADATTITLNGVSTSQWADKSGNGRNATQATAANQPTYVTGQNLLQWSEQFQQGSWQRASVDVQANVATAPDGTLTADKVIATAVSGAHTLYQIQSIGAAAPYTFVIRAKAAEYNFVTVAGCVEVSGGALTRYSATVNLTTGAITKTASVGTTISPTSTTRDIGNGWWEITVSLSSASATSVLFVLCPTSTANPTQDGFLNATFTGDGTSGVLVWGAQINSGTAVTTYQKTEATAITSGTINGKPSLAFDNSDDSLNYDGAFLANTDYTVTAVISRSVDRINNWFLGGSSGVTNTNFLMGFENPSTKLRWGQFGNDVDTAGITYFQNVPLTAIAIHSGTAGKSTFINGTAGGTTPNTTPLSSNPVAQIGRFLGLQSFGGSIGEIVMVRSALPTADRQRLEGYLAWKWGGF